MLPLINTPTKVLRIKGEVGQAPKWSTNAEHQQNVNPYFNIFKTALVFGQVAVFSAKYKTVKFPKTKEGEQLKFSYEIKNKGVWLGKIDRLRQSTQVNLQP